MRFKNLAQLKRPELFEITLGNLPQSILISEYARQKAFKICETVDRVFGQSFEWYGYTMADMSDPELITDIGLPKNDLNLPDYATLGSARIAEFQENLPPHLIINGWIHSHGALHYKHFSVTDEQNHRTVLDFVAARTRRQLAKKEIAIEDLVLLVRDRFHENDLERGSVSLITDIPINEAKILETVYGSFCYCMVIGDEGWHEQVILYHERGALSARTTTKSRPAQIKVVDTEKIITPTELDSLANEVKQKIRPNRNPPVEKMERM